MITVHRDRYSTSNVVARKRGVVVHTSEGGEQSANVLMTLFERPGDRLIEDSDPPRWYGSSYHAVTLNDPAAGYVEILPATAGPFAGPPRNKDWWHICIPARAAQSRGEWLGDSSRQGILAVAKFCVTKALTDGFPLTRVGPTELLAGRGGYCGHVDLRDAWHQTTHFDPGPHFPWDVLQADIVALLTDPEVPMDVKPDLIISSPNHGPAILFPETGRMTGLSEASRNAWVRARGAVELMLTDVEWEDFETKALVSQGYGTVKKVGGAWVFTPNQ